MGIVFSSLMADALDEAFEAVFVRPIGNLNNGKSSFRSFSFNGRDTEPTNIMKAFGSGKLLIEGSLSFNKRHRDPFQLETKISVIDDTPEKTMATDLMSPNRQTGFKRSRFSPQTGEDPKHEAAVKLQKVYKSFRTRRQLADCAVLVEQRWWKLLDFAMLKRSSISFFDIEKPESAFSRWSRARTRAAKVGKGLSKDEKARKLELQHWLEAIDPRHRYGHNLHFYYDSWLQCESKQPFFYWLDVGEGKEVNLEEKCPRSNLQQQCIKYLGPKEREAYEVIVEDGEFLYKKTRELLDTFQGPKDTKWIFVLSTTRALYVGQKKKGYFQHSSFLAGGATSAAGRLVVENGVLKAVWPHSGHYRPTEQNFQEFMSFLKEYGVNLSEVKRSPVEEDESNTRLKCVVTPKRIGSATESTNLLKILEKDGTLSRKIVSDEEDMIGSETHKTLCGLSEEQQRGKPCREGIAQHFEDNQRHEEEEISSLIDPTLTEEGQVPPKKINDGTKFINTEEDKEDFSDDDNGNDHYMFCKKNLLAEDEKEDGEDALIPDDWILQRVNSRKGIESFQLGKKLSFKWTTGAGPRIGCVRDYPSGIQSRALEQVSLSPRSGDSVDFSYSYTQVKKKQ